MVHTEQQAIKGSKIRCVKPFKQENQQSNLQNKGETTNTFEHHLQTTTTEQQVHDLGQLQTHTVWF